MWVREALVPLDASFRDGARLDAATSLALSSGASITLFLPCTASALRRLGGFAEGEGLTPAGAAEQYVARAADSLAAWGIDARGLSAPSSDPAHDIAWCARRRGASLVLLLPSAGRFGAGTRLGQRLLRLSSVPVLTFPVAPAHGTGAEAGTAASSTATEAA